MPDLADLAPARDTRRKVLLGALALYRLEKPGSEEFAKELGNWLKKELPAFLMREADRELFGDLLKAGSK